MVAVLSDPRSGYLTMVTGHWSNTPLPDRHRDIHHSHELVQEQFVGTTEIGQKDCHRSIFSPLCRPVSDIRLILFTLDATTNSFLCLLNARGGPWPPLYQKKSRQTLLTCLLWIHWCSCGVMRDALHLAREMGNQRLINLIRVLVPHSQHFLCLLHVKLHSHFNTINACSIQFLLQTWNESQKPTNWLELGSIL